MKYLSNFALGLGALALAASCSNDEPANNGNVQIPEGQQAYMRVNVQSADDGSRSTVIGGYEYGDAQEHAVANAHFFFFDADGIYVGSANIWRDGHNGTTPNIEYMGSNVLVLDNLDSNTYPNYVLTVLNRPAGFNPTAGQTAADITRELTEFGALGNFVMSTSSYYTPAADAASDTHHDNAYPYLTKLNPEDFFLQPVGSKPTDAQIAALTPVDIYVERVAAKVKLNVTASASVTTAGGDKLFQVDATVAGDPNGELVGSLAGTQLYVKIVGWDLTNTVNKSYMAKQLLPGWEGTEPFTAWQPAYTDHRSFWAESWVYADNSDDPTTPIRPAADRFSYKSFSELAQSLGDVAYCNENTNTPLNIGGNVIGEGTSTQYAVIPSYVTSVMVKAQVTDATGTGLDLVKVNGLLFTYDQYKSYILGGMKADHALPYYIRTGEAPNYTYTQIGENLGDFAVVSANETSPTLVKLSYAPATTPSLWKRTGGNESDGYTYEATNVTTINDAFNTYQTSLQVEGFKGGDMYYNIPIEHFANNGAAQMPVDHEGYYGVVRNHYYTVNITSVNQLGHGVFDPDKDIINDKTDPTHRYYLAAKINILAWKIITQNTNI